MQTENPGPKAAGKPGWNWVLRMALRDAQRNRSKLVLFTSAIVLGVAALVAISSFRANLLNDIQAEKKALLGADMVLWGYNPPQGEMAEIIDTLSAVNRSTEYSFSSLVAPAQSVTDPSPNRLTGAQATPGDKPELTPPRLTNVRALNAGFPFYGEIETQPAGLREQLGPDAPHCLADPNLLLQLGVELGDSLQIGRQRFKVVGEIVDAPGQVGFAASVAPRVYIPLAYMDATQLEKGGSRIAYRYYFQFPENYPVEQVSEKLEKPTEQYNLRKDTVQGRQDNLGRVFGYLTNFLSLVGFVALLLGCLGLASAIQLYLREKRNTVAVLRCLGAPSNLAFRIFLIQVVGIGLLGALAGVLLGSLIQALLPEVLNPVLPVEVSRNPQPLAMLVGLAVGAGIALLFALPPLLTIRRISPLAVLRNVSQAAASADHRTWLVGAAIFLFITGFAWVQTQSWQLALGFTGGSLVAFAVLAAVAKGLLWLLRRAGVQHMPFTLRQGLANLYRPNNQTALLVVALGLGTLFIATLFFIQNLILGQFDLEQGENNPNLVLFDIQPEQVDSLEQFTRQRDLPVLNTVPLVTMRLTGFRGRSRMAIKQDSTADVPEDILDREYRVTYRPQPNQNETIVAGEWVGRYSGSGPVPISMSENHFRRMGAEIGDKVTFNVQGAPVETVIRSVRKIDFSRLEPVFTVVFPTNVLEEAPTFHVLLTRVDSAPQAAAYQTAILHQFPNVRAVDLKQILKTADEVITEASLAVQFMALFSILTGLVVLVSSIRLSRYQRLRETVLLRTLGASRRVVRRITAAEYALIGFLAVLVGLLLALLAAWVLAFSLFDSTFVPQPLPVLGLLVGLTGLTTLIGLLNTRKLLRSPPLEVLRAETG